MEARHREGLEDGIPATRRGVCIEEILGVCWPKGLVELHEDFSIGSNIELVDSSLLPLGQFRGEGHNVVLENAK